MATAQRPRRQPAEVRKEQILDAAERVLLAQGFAATTVADVADEAGLAKGTVYLQFASKNDLIAALRARYLARFAAALGSSRRRAHQRLLQVAHGLYEFSVEHHALHHVLFHEAGFSEDDAFEGAHRLVVEIVRDGVAQGEFAVDDPDLAAVFVLHGVHGALVHALHDGTSRARFTKAIDQIVLRALGAR
jgi:AcrR family transcriptional regulator